MDLHVGEIFCWVLLGALVPGVLLIALLLKDWKSYSIKSRIKLPWMDLELTPRESLPLDPNPERYALAISRNFLSNYKAYNFPKTKLKIGYAPILCQNSSSDVPPPCEPGKLDCFYEAITEKRLVIAGAQGSGKTGALLEVGKSLCSKGSYVVLVSIASWKPNFSSFEHWIIEQLSTNQNLPHAVTRALLAQDKLVLLLDGLDELETSKQVGFVKSLNSFIINHGLTEILMTAQSDTIKSLPSLCLWRGVELFRLSERQMMHFWPASKRLICDRS